MAGFISVPLTCAVVYGALTVIVMLRPSRVRVFFALYLFAATLWSLGSALAHFNLDHQQTYFWAKMIVIAGNPMMIFYYQFVRRFTGKSTDVWTYLGYAIFSAVIFFTVSGYILRDAYFANGQLYMDYANHVTNILILINSSFMIGAVIALIKFYRGSIDSADRTRTVYLLIGITTFAAIGMTKAVPFLFRYPLDYVGGAINALIITYIILKYQLLDIKFVLRKGLVYSSLTVFLTTLYLLLLFSMQKVFQGWAGYSSLALAAGFALVAAVLLNPLRDFIQKWIDRIFYRETYDYRQMLLHFSDRISNVLDLRELTQSILDPVINAMHVKYASLLFPEVGSGDFTTRFSLHADGDKPNARLKFTNANPIVTWLDNKGEALHYRMIEIFPQFKGLWEVEKIALNALGIELFCPIRSKGKLTGILALGKKQSDSMYSDEEVDLLMTMANEAAVALENARMLDSIKSQQLQVEQLLGQVVIAQEEERKRISADLHDSVAQWLAAASYRVQTVNALLPANSTDEARGELVTMEDTIDKSLKELRRIVVGLRPPALDELGLIHALRQSLEELKAEGLDCKFEYAGEPVRLSSNLEIAIFRVIQEAITNIRKHAEATRVNLNLEYQPDRFLVQIRDNGKGFDIARTFDSAVAIGRMGILGMKQRAETLGGEMNIKTNEGEGTTITLSFPIQSPVEDR